MIARQCVLRFGLASSPKFNHTKFSHPKFNQTAFTLVELVSIIAILAILAAVGSSRFVGNDAFEVRGAYDTLLSALHFAQKTAIAQRRTVYANINTTSRVVCLGYTTNCSTAVNDPATQAAYSKTLPASVTLTVSANPIGFDALGRPSPNAAASINIHNAVVATEIDRTISIEAETGYVR